MTPTIPRPPRRSWPPPSPAAPSYRPLAAPAADPFGGFTVGVQSYTFRNFDLEQALKRTKELGLKYAEFYRSHIPTDSSPEKIKGILKLCKEYDVTPVAFGVERFTKDHDANKKLFDFGKAPRGQVPQRRPDPGQLRQPRQAVRGVQDRHRHPPARAVGEGDGTAGSRPRSS